MSGVPDTLTAPTAITLFVLFDTLLVVLEGLATTTRVGQHRRRSYRAQGVLRDACNASDLRPPNPHATMTRIYTTAQSSMTSLHLPTAPHMAHASFTPRQTPQRPATAPHEPQSALSRH